MFKRIDHTELVTDHPERMVQFYTEVLGFSLRERDRVGAPGKAVDLAYVELGGTTVEIITYDGEKPAPVPSDPHLGYKLIALEVENMDAALAYLKTKSIEAVWGPLQRERYARAEIEDPDGNHIELREWK